MKLGDKVIWIDDDNKQKKTGGKVTNALVNGDVVISWDNGRVINYSQEQIRNMKEGHYSGIIILDHQSMRNDRLQELGI
jgi:hypothetical protein